MGLRVLNQKKMLRIKTMEEIRFDKERINNSYELIDVKIRKLKILRDALLRSIDSNRINIDELLASKERVSSNADRDLINKEIDLQKSAASKSEELLNKYEQEITKWEEKLKGAATNILESFDHNELEPN